MTTLPPGAGAHRFRMFEVLPRLYLSRFPENISTKITHVLNLCTIDHPFDSTRTYLQIPMLDIDDITPHIAAITSFIDTALQANGEILVHCALGENRSASAIIAYLSHRNSTSSAEALTFLKERKPDVRPSFRFLRQIDISNGRVPASEEDPLVQFHERLQERNEKTNRRMLERKEKLR